MNNNEKMPYIYAIQTEEGLRFDYEYEYGDLVVETLPIHLVDRRLDKELISSIEFAYHEGVEAGISIGRKWK